MASFIPIATERSAAMDKTAQWTADEVARIEPSPQITIATIGAGDVRPVVAGLDFWDMWPIATSDGATARFDGREVWMALSAPSLADPGARHDIARIRLLVRDGDDYRDCGDALSDGFSAGSREWAGSAVVAGDGRTVTLYFTASGRRGERTRTIEQRLFEATADLSWKAGAALLVNWRTPRECVTPDDDVYIDTQRDWGRPGLIRGFRDPAYFRDPADGCEYLLFVGSLKGSASAYNGLVGLAARALDGQWRLAPPLVSADGLNNELERPHIVVHQGAYYLFWSTQRHMFAPGGPAGPNGLYGMVAPSLFGPYQPLNGGGLVAANPLEEPTQAYSWWVTGELEVVSFIDYWGMHGRTLQSDPALLRAKFGGAPAPRFRLALDGVEARIVR